MKFHSIAQKIAYTALFATIALVFNIVTMPDTPIGTISFTYVPCFLAGIVLGPVLGFTAGLCGDLLGCIIAPKGAISMLILLSSGCLGLISGLVFRFIKRDNLTLKFSVTYVIVLVVCTLGLASIGNYIVATFLQNKYLTFWNYLLIARLPKQPFVLLLNVLLTYSVVLLMRRQPSLKKLVNHGAAR